MAIIHHTVILWMKKKFFLNENKYKTNTNDEK